MKTRVIIGFILLFTIISTSNKTFALPTTQFSSTSKLASGKWVKIQVSETGIHEISAKQLAEMGFSDISKVKIFGKGGYVIDEVLNENIVDDLPQVPTTTYNGKIIFYAKGATQMTIDQSAENPYYIGKINPYSKYGHYFVTDSDNFQALNINTTTLQETTGNINQHVCYDYVYHNNEIFSFLCSGKTFYGENLLENYNLTFSMPNRVESYPITLSFSLGSDVSATKTVSASINGTDIPLTSNSIPKLGSNRKFEICSPIGSSSTITPADNYSLKINIAGSGVNSANLDYYAITYIKDTSFPSDSTQMRLGFINPTMAHRVELKNIHEIVYVWDVTHDQPKNQFTLNEGEGNNIFQLSSTDNWAQHIAFKPSKQLKPVTILGTINNSNLHSMETPDMVIIHPANFKAQAEKLAEIHRTIDKFDVIVAEEQAIFNEFSSGTHDAMAYRLFLKMLYDRNPKKLKYLLLFGCGSYDNRRINGGKSENQLLTYQSDDSQGTVSSYTTDDFFGFLADGSGKSIPSDILSISVGRIPAKMIEEAEAAIAKIYNYITATDFEEWKSNLLIISDKGDNDLHTSQAEGLEDVLLKTMKNEGLNIEKAYQEWYTRTSLNENTGGTENDGRDKIERLLKEGLSFVSYIGHAGPISLTHDDRIWNKAKVSSTKYKSLPFFSIAGCDAAQFDNESRCISEEFVLTPEGGAIGVLAATRTVYSSQNDKLNKAIAEKLYSLNENGEYRTLGEACTDAKKTFGTAYNYNKLSFTLFGDPAVKFRFPINRCKINTINDITIGSEDIALSPLSTVKIAGVINTESDIIDESFNGEATITIYDKAVKFKDITSPSTKVVYPSFYPREKLCHTTVKVEKGKFNASITLPANCLAQGDSCLIRVFAKSQNNDLASGSENRFIINACDNTIQINDDKAPKITQISIDGQNAKNKVYVSSNPIITFSITDNYAINTKANDIQGSMKLLVDNGKVNIQSLSNHTTALDGGKAVNGNIQLHNLSKGKHSIYIEASDIAGNSTSKEYIFYVVEDNADCELTTTEEAVSTSATFKMNTEYNVDKCFIHIRDNANNIVLAKEISGTSFSWDLKDRNGNRAKPGRYSVYSSFYGDGAYGIAEPINIIVLKK